MAILIPKKVIEYDNEIQHLRIISKEAMNLVQILEDYLDSKTTRSQLNKALKK